MVMAGARDGKYQYYVCSLYHNANHHYTKKCSRHGVRRDVIEDVVLTEIRDVWSYARKNATEFAERVRKSSDKETAKAIKTKTSELNKADRRIAELDRIIKRIYEDHIAEKLSDERFSKMLADYEVEQAELISGTVALRAEVDELRQSAANIKSFMDTVERFVEVPELTADIARTFVDKVLIHEATFEDSKWGRFHQSRQQEITVVFNGIGEFKVE
jgi:hypothetical protein